MYAEEAVNGNFSVRNGTAIVERLSRQLSSEFTAIRDSLRESSRVVSEMFSDSGCCSEDCVGRDRTKEDCVRVCNASNPAIADYYKAQYGMDTTGGRENGMEDVFQIDNFQYSFARNVSFNYSAVHIPLDIYDKGVCVCVLVC